MSKDSGFWQTSCDGPNERGAYLLKTKLWSDCEFAVGANGARVRAHRLVLAASSPVMAAMFYGPLAERCDAVLIPDMELVDFEAMLQYIYTNDVDIASCDMACCLYYGAQKYMLPYLMPKCVEYLMSHLDVPSVCCCYEFGQLIEDGTLVEHCIEFIKRKTIKVITDASFLQASIETVLRVLSLEPLNVPDELELYRAVERYAMVDHEDDKDWSSKIRAAVQLIRFLTLTPRQAGQLRREATLLTENELEAINSICKRNKKKTADMNAPNLTDCALPGGLSICTKLRNRLRSEGTVTVTMPGLRNLQYYYSKWFVVRGLSWRLHLRPGYQDTTDRVIKWLDAVIECNWIQEAEWSCVATAQFALLSAKGDVAPKVMEFDQLQWHDECDQWGSYFVKYDEILDPKLGYVTNDTITLEVNVIVHDDDENPRSIEDMETLGHREMESDSDDDD